MTEVCQPSRRLKVKDDELTAAPQSRDTALSDLSVAKDVIRLKTWNGSVPPAENRCVDQVIQEHCDRQPQAAAVSAWDAELSFAELDASASALGALLVRKGVGAECFVPICFEKSAYVVVAILAVCKAGGAFVLLDPAQPSQRLLSTLKQVKATVCLSSSRQESRLAELLPGLDCIPVHAAFLQDLPKVRVPSASSPKPTDACYVNFTSGSTGEPKGVVIEHRNLVKFGEVNRMLMQLETQPVQSRVLQFSSYAFDGYVMEIVASLCAGACVCIPSDESRSGDLAGAMSSLRVNRAALTPSVLRLLTPSQVPELEVLAVAGEPITRELIEMWSESLRMINCYGPCECTVGSLANLDMDRLTDCANIGYAYGSVGWIVDPEDSNVLLPVGEVGELLIEGPLVGRGYLNNPAKTAASYITDPLWIRYFRKSKGNRMYKTGDLVRYASDGSFRFVGRKDTQVKIRGQRIETSEVEFHLRNSHEQVREAVADVIVAADSSLDRAALVAWISLEDGSSASDVYEIVNQVEKAMEARVPRYMVPSLIIPLPELPLAHSGKTDRKTLRQTASAKTTAELRSLRPSAPLTSALTPDETFLRQLWSKVLGVEAGLIAPTDRFIALGGDSIQAIKLSTEARLKGQMLAVKDVLQHPQLDEMARRMSVSSGGVSESEGTVSQPEEQPEFDELQALLSMHLHPSPVIDRVEPATDVQEDAVSQSLLPNHGAVLYNAIEMRGSVNVETLKRACYRLSQRHEILRTIFVMSNGQLQQVILKELEPEFSVLDKTSCETENGGTHTEQQLHTEACIEDLSKGDFGLGRPGLKFLLLKHSEDFYTLIMRICHSNFDGTSLNRLCSDLCDDYQSLESVSRTSFVEYLKEASQTRNQESYDYWRKLLRGARMAAVVSRTLPDFISPADCTLTRSVEISRARSLGMEATWATVSKAAWAVVLSQLCGRRDVAFGHLVGGRNVPMPGVEDVVGPCLGDIPVRVQFDPSWSTADLLAHVQQQYLAGIAHETLPFPEIVRQCTDWPAWSRMSSYLHFQNLQIEREFKMGDDVACRMLDSYEAPLDAADLYVMVTPHEESLDVEISFSKAMVPEELVHAALDRFCELIRLFSGSDAGSLSLQDQLKGSIDGFKLPVERTTAKVDVDRRVEVSEEAGQRIRSVLTDAWHRVLPHDSARRQKDEGKERDFFHLGGDFPRLTYLSEALKEQGYIVGVEELVYRPGFEAQMDLLATKEVAEDRGGTNEEKSM